MIYNCRRWDYGCSGSTTAVANNLLSSSASTRDVIVSMRKLLTTTKEIKRILQEHIPETFTVIEIRAGLHIFYSKSYRGRSIESEKNTLVIHIIPRSKICSCGCLWAPLKKYIVNASITGARVISYFDKEYVQEFIKESTEDSPDADRIVSAHRWSKVTGRCKPLKKSGRKSTKKVDKPVVVKEVK